jgi:hypothetical protein
MADMNETPGNKNSQDQILIQDNSAVRTYKEDTSSTDSNGSPNALKVTPRQKKKKKYRKKQNKTTPDTTKQPCPFHVHVLSLINRWPNIVILDLYLVYP